MTVTFVVLTFVLGFLAQRPIESTLYSSSVPRPEDVIQGRLGSCYFHASMAALASVAPDQIQRRIETGKQGSYAVRFPNDVLETVYPDDLSFARDNGFDRSAGMWLGVLLRAYGQKVLRDALAHAFEQSTTMTPAMRAALVKLVRSTDLPLLAYDRAIRSQISQEGNLDAQKLKKDVNERLRNSALPEGMRDQLLQILDSKELFSALQKTIKENGEVFGAYRAIGNGGLPERVFRGFLGTNAQTIVGLSESRAEEILRSAFAQRQPVVAATGRGIIASIQYDWYVATHAFTVLGFDSTKGLVTLRNPWGSHPDPGGVFTIPLSTFVKTFDALTVSPRR